MCPDLSSFKYSTKISVHDDWENDKATFSSPLPVY